MAPKKKAGNNPKATDYRHTGATRKNIPPAQIAAEGKVPTAPKVRYHYNPHLPPVLRFDSTGKTDRLPDLLAEAGRRALTEKEQTVLAEALRNQQPWLEWAGKREQHERGFFDVDPVALHIHERVSAQACIRAAMREDVQRDLFADPQQPYQEAVQFYRHDVDWANRLILGDSLSVMASLAEREDLTGKVQMIYMDPPYGIRYGSNFQPQVGKLIVKDADSDVTREPETVRAYRDTWHLGVHSYLTYLSDRLRIARTLLTESGSLFLQIGQEHAHKVGIILDDVFGPENLVAVIPFRKKTMPLGTTFAEQMSDFILWYARCKYAASGRPVAKYIPLFRMKSEDPDANYKYVQDPTYARRQLTPEERENPSLLGAELSLYRLKSLEPSGPMDTGRFRPLFQGRRYDFPKNGYGVPPEGMNRLIHAGRIQPQGSLLNYVLFLRDNPASSLTVPWHDTAGPSDKRFAVQTAEEVVKRCMLMTTDPGDLVLDPTCGSGTTAYVAEQWGRRWITIDTSRVAVAIARQRILTARYPFYVLRPIESQDRQRNPNGRWLREPNGTVHELCTFKCGTAPHITLSSISNNAALDAVFKKHEAELAVRLKTLNTVMRQVSDGLSRTPPPHRAAKVEGRGTESRAGTRPALFELPTSGWQEWEVPYNAVPDWPQSLRSAFDEYRKAWRARMQDVEACIAENAGAVLLVDQPEVAKDTVRVSGPFTVEGVRPEELSLGEAGLFDPTPNEFSEGTPTVEREPTAYLAQMVQHLRRDGLTFVGNKRRAFARLESLLGQQTALLVHAEGAWDGEDAEGNPVAVSFGPQYGPVTAEQVEEVIRTSKRYDELVIAGFSFDAEATATIQQAQHPKLRVHQAYIRPDINPGMEGLLKDTPNSELFTVFGQPEVKVAKARDDHWTVTLEGVDIYDPVENTIRSTGAEKVAAWFLDSDFDGRCFCITQAFFPDQNAWERIAKALGSAADPEAFEAFKGTKSLPFPTGKHRRIAVKVIDPRGNEVMAIRNLEG